MNKFQKKVAIFLIAFAMLCAVFCILFNTVWMLSFIPSESMEDTIKKGDLVFATRLETDEKDIKRYDILIFTPLYEADTDTLIKRVVGLPGEVIKIKNGRVFADGVELDNDFIKEPQDNDGDGTYVVPEGHYFFLGDNRNDSFDSRFWDDPYVPFENIKAKAKYIIFPSCHKKSFKTIFAEIHK